MKLKKHIYYLFFFYFLLLFSCRENKKGTCKNNDGNLDAILQHKFSEMHFSLASLDNYPFVIRYGYSDYLDSEVLTVTKNGDKYFIQLIQNISNGIPPFRGVYKKPYYKITEKVLTEKQVDKMFEMINGLRCIPGELESRFTASSLNYFGIIIKIFDEVIYFSGIPLDNSDFGEDITSLKRGVNKEKMKVLDFIGFLLRAGGVIPDKKVIYSDKDLRSVGDSISYRVSLFSGKMVRSCKVYLDGELIDDSYLLEIKLPYSDTLSIEDRIKIKTVEWDNVKMEY